MAFKFNTDFINLGPLTSTNFGIEPINLSNVGPVAPLSNADSQHQLLVRQVHQ
jgi:hypothetical protein